MLTDVRSGSYRELAEKLRQGQKCRVCGLGARTRVRAESEPVFRIGDYRESGWLQPPQTLSLHFAFSSSTLTSPAKGQATALAILATVRGGEEPPYYPTHSSHLELLGQARRMMTTSHWKFARAARNLDPVRDAAFIAM